MEPHPIDRDEYIEGHATEAPWRSSFRSRLYFISLGCLSLAGATVLVYQTGLKPGWLLLITGLVLLPLAGVIYMLRLATYFKSAWPRRIAGLLLWPFAALPSVACLLCGLFGVNAMWTLWLYGGAAAVLHTTLAGLYAFNTEAG